MTKVKTVKKVNALKKRADRAVNASQTMDELLNSVLYIAGYFHKGKNKGGKIAVQVRNVGNLNPVEPILSQYPDIEVVLVGKNQEAVRKYLKKLAD